MAAEALKLDGGRAKSYRRAPRKGDSGREVIEALESPDKDDDEEKSERSHLSFFVFSFFYSSLLFRYDDASL